MKNDETYSKNNHKDKNKLMPLKSTENVLKLLEQSSTMNSSKTPNLLSPKGQESNNKMGFKANEITYKNLDFKYNPNNNNNNTPPLFINSNQVNNIINNNNNYNNNHNSKLQNFNSTSGNNENSPKNKDLTKETFKNLFKLNYELNIYLEPNKPLRFNTIENSIQQPHKASKSHFSHSTRNFNNTLLTNSNNANNAKTNFNQINNKNFNSKNQSSNLNFNKTSNLRKSYYQKFEPELQMINLDKYSSLVTETMGNYRIESLPADLNNENLNDDILQTHNRTLGFPSFNKTLIGKSNQHLNITYGDNAFMKINVNDKEYVNPIDSLKILDTNKNIFSNVSTSLINIQKMYYDKTINGIEKYNEFKKNMCKVRISNIMPKNTDFLSLFKSKDSLLGEKNSNPLAYGTAQSSSNLNGLVKNNLAEAANKGNRNLNEAESSHSNKERSAESIEKEKILEKQREKERERERERENRREKKKKNEIKFKNKIMRPDEMELYAHYKYSTKNFPEGREQFAFDYNLAEIVLFGGIVTNKNNHVWTLDPISLEWDKKNTDNIPPYPRYGHTGIIHQKRIYVFGGKCKSNNYHYIADLDIFDLTDNQWFTPNFSSKTSLELRRNHVADLIGSQMIIHGGINEENKLLSDAHVLSLSPLKWNTLNISEFTPGPALSGHASAVVLPLDIRYNTKTSLYKFPENLFGKIISNRMREKGWYLFGGINSEEGTITNELWILRLGRKPLEWIKPNVRGKPPLPRYAHTLNYYEEGNFLVCHGGRNDFSSQSFALNDTHIFDLSKMEWQEIKLYSDMDNFNVFNRCGHNAVIFTNKLIIFGGMNNMNYLGSSLLIINLDFNYKFQKEAEHDNSFDSSEKKKGKGHKNKKNNINDYFGKNECEHVFLPPIK